MQRGGMFRHGGPRTRRLAAILRRRASLTHPQRRLLDGNASARLFARRGIVYTDTADFTRRTVRDGILHFLMVFDRVVAAAAPLLRRSGGEIVKVEGDSLLLRFPDASAACRGVDALQRLLRDWNRVHPAGESMRFSYGIGYGDVLELEEDVFGLEVNLASKIGEDLARPGQVLLTPAAAAALDARTLRRVVPYKVVRFGRRAVPVRRLRPAGRSGSDR